MKHGSLFSGIGGFDLAAEWMGWENVFHCEWNPFGQRILKHYWPNAKSYDDITKTDFTSHRGAIDILTGGFPCQPYSLAGKRKGKADDRHLWPEMLRAIREIQPQWVVGENVFGIVNWNGGMVFDEVQADLEAEGYEVWPYVLPACAINAPHRRDRVWFVAYFDKCTTRPPRESDRIIGEGSNYNDEPKERGEQTEQYIGCSDVLQVDTNTTNTRIESVRQKRKDSIHGLETITNSNGKSIKKKTKRESEVGFKSGEEIRDKYRTMGNPDSIGWDEWPTQSPVCSGNDGLPDKLDGITFSKWRNESIKAYGNAIVPQVALQIFKAIEAYSSLK